MRNGYEEIGSTPTPMPTAGRITFVSCFRGLSLIWKTVFIIILAFLLSIGLSLCLSMVWSPPVSHIDYPTGTSFSYIKYFRTYLLISWLFDKLVGKQNKIQLNSILTTVT